jgi:aspartate/methionine/tyrosine aminotransferase
LLIPVPMAFQPFAMERWQSTWENRVDFNLSESGVHPLTVGELLALAGGGDVTAIALGYGQSNGSDALRERIARLYPGADDAGVVVTNGSAEANFVACWERLSPGDEAAIVMPTYMQTHGLARNFGATVRPIPLHEEDGWQPRREEIEAAITSRTRLVVVTNPVNPTGSILGSNALDAIIAAAGRHGAWILTDEVYAGAELDGRETPSLFGRYEKVIATGSLSKAYGLPGLRIGWAVTDPHTAERLWARTDYTSISTGTLTDELACIALDERVRPQLLERTRARIRAGLDVLEDWLRDVGGFTWQPPAAGAICYARYDAPIDSLVLAERLRTEKSVLIVPGAHFAMDRFVRFGFGIPLDELRAALARCAELLQPAAVGVRR